MEAIHFKQILANDYAYLYELRSFDKEGIVVKIWYEVYIRKENEGGLAERIGARDEYQPTVMDSEDEVFGVLAWESYSLSRAWSAYQTITNYYKTKKNTELKKELIANKLGEIKKPKKITIIIED